MGTMAGYRAGKRDKTTLVLGLLAGSVGIGVVAMLVKRWQEAHLKYLARGPRTKKKPKKILFGKVEGENRGPNPDALMDPPVEAWDDYNWLRDDTRKNREVLQCLRRENRYTELKTKHLHGLKKELYKDLLAHLKETDNEYPYPWGSYYYLTRTEEGKSYEIICRRRSMEDGAEETVLLDINLLAKSEGLSFCDIGHWEPSPDHTILGYSVDSTGYETYELRFIDLAAGKTLGVIAETSGSFVWGADSSVVYYMKMDEQHRPFQLYRHVMGTPCSEDVLIAEEHDELLWMSIGKTDSGRFMVMTLAAKDRSESHVMDLEGAVGADGHATRELRVVEPRREEHRYSAEHQGDYFYIITNKDDAVNSKFVRAPVTDPSGVNWEDVFPYDPSIKLDTAYMFSQYIAIFGRQGGFKNVWIFDPATGDRHKMEQPEAVYTVMGGHHNVYDTEVLRVEYSSPTTPRTTFDYNMRTGEKVQLKQTEVPNYDSTLYACDRIEATGHDGVKIPVSLVYKKTTYPRAPTMSPRPLLLYGYGSYGSCIDPWFVSSRITLLDRGVAFAIGHIRGGGEMGREWYEKEGKYLTKKNTFKDFISCAEELVKRNYTSPDMLAIQGASAGGLLIGATINMRPDLFRVAVAEVPFVDVLTTMADASIPLTVCEWAEWGNPNERKFYEYMKKYSPIDNVQRKAYPAMLVTGGLNDPRVAYWEPAKWVSKLREHKTDSNVLLCKIDMGSGHAGASDRYKYLDEKAFVFAFLLDQLGVR